MQLSLDFEACPAVALFGLAPMHQPLALLGAQLAGVEQPGPLLLRPPLHAGNERRQVRRHVRPDRAEFSGRRARRLPVAPVILLVGRVLRRPKEVRARLGAGAFLGRPPAFKELGDSGLYG